MERTLDNQEPLKPEEVNVILSENLEGVASLIERLEEQASENPVTPSELAAIRSIIQSCLKILDDQSFTLS